MLKLTFIADYVLLCLALFQQKPSKRTCNHWIENNHNSAKLRSCGVLVLLRNVVLKFECLVLMSTASLNIVRNIHTASMLQPRTTLLRHFNIISISRHGTIVSKRNKFAPLPTPDAVLFRLSSSSVHFLCYRKQHCNRGGGKQSFNLRQ